MHQMDNHVHDIYKKLVILNILMVQYRRNNTYVVNEGWCLKCVKVIKEGSTIFVFYVTT